MTDTRRVGMLKIVAAVKQSSVSIAKGMAGGVKKECVWWLQACLSLPVNLVRFFRFHQCYKQFRRFW